MWCCHCGSCWKLAVTPVPGSGSRWKLHSRASFRVSDDLFKWCKFLLVLLGRRGVYRFRSWKQKNTLIFETNKWSLGRVGAKKGLTKVEFSKLFTFLTFLRQNFHTQSIYRMKCDKFLQFHSPPLPPPSHYTKTPVDEVLAAQCSDNEKCKRRYATAQQPLSSRHLLSLSPSLTLQKNNNQHQ